MSLNVHEQAYIDQSRDAERVRRVSGGLSRSMRPSPLRISFSPSAQEELAARVDTVSAARSDSWAVGLFGTRTPGEVYVSRLGTRRLPNARPGFKYVRSQVAADEARSELHGLRQVAGPHFERVGDLMIRVSDEPYARDHEDIERWLVERQAWGSPYAGVIVGQKPRGPWFRARTIGIAFRLAAAYVVTGSSDQAAPADLIGVR